MARKWRKRLCQNGNSGLEKLLPKSVELSLYLRGIAVAHVAYHGWNDLAPVQRGMKGSRIAASRLEPGLLLHAQGVDHFTDHIGRLAAQLRESFGLDEPERIGFQQAGLVARFKARQHCQEADEISIVPRRVRNAAKGHAAPLQKGSYSSHGSLAPSPRLPQLQHGLPFHTSGIAHLVERGIATDLTIALKEDPGYVCGIIGERGDGMPTRLPTKPDFEMIEAAAIDSADHRTRILALIGNLVFSWSNNESMFIYVLMILLETDEVSAAIVFATLNTTRARLDLVQRLAKAKVGDRETAKALENLIDRFNDCTRVRNEFNHCMYTVSDRGEITHTHAMKIRETGGRLVLGEIRAMDENRIRELMGTVNTLKRLNRELWDFLPRLQASVRPPQPAPTEKR